MDYRVEQSKHKLLSELEKLNQVGSLNPDALKNMACIIDGLHHIEEIEMLDEVGDNYEERYGRAYRGYDRRAGGRRYRRDDNDDMRVFMEESLRRATNEGERERIRRLMNEL